LRETQFWKILLIIVAIFFFMGLLAGFILGAK